MKQGKKVLSVLLVVVLLLGCLPMGASAVQKGTVSISAGKCQTAVIDPDGALWVRGAYRGDGSVEDSTPAKVLEDVTFVDCGRNNIAAVKKDGSLWVWGRNIRGELGSGIGHDKIDPDTDSPVQSVPIKVMDNVVAVSTAGSCDFDGGYFAAIKTDGTLWTWGLNRLLSLGNGTSDETIYAPQKILDDVTSVSCGGWYNAAIKSDGSLWTWGDDGAIGNGSKTGSNRPVKIMESGIVAVSCSISHAAALKEDGSLWMWGISEDGRLTNSVTGNDLLSSDLVQTVPVKVMDQVSAVSCGYNFTSVLKTDGSLWTFGTSDCGSELGRGDNKTDEGIPQKIADNVIAIDSGYWHSVMLKSDGTIWGYGKNMYGALGWSYSKPNLISSLSDIVSSGNSSGNEENGEDKVSFVDVYSDAYYANAVKWAVENKITSGTSATRFSPNNSCTRAQAVTFLWRAAGEPEPQSMENSFADVKAGDYYEKAVRWAVENDVTAGTSATRFSPNSTCTRAQIVTFLWRSQGSPVVSGTTFSDIKAGDYYENAVKWAVEQEITAGTSAEKFSPGSKCTRGQIVTFLYRCL